jgi:hypothetical protein
MHSLAQTLADALQEEYKAQKENLRAISLFSGKRLLSFAGHTYYQFEIPEESLPNNIELAHFTLGVKEPVAMKGNIIELRNQFLIVALPIDFGPDLPEIKCQWNIDEEYRPVLEILSTYNVQSDLASVLFEPNPSMNSHIVPIEPRYPAQIFPEQREALEKILHNKVTVLWGPISSGKSYTLALAAVTYAAAGKSVLLVTPTNTSTDSIFKQVVALLHQFEFGFGHECTRYDLPSPELVEDIAPYSFELEIEKLKEEKRAVFKERISLMEKYWSVKRKQVLNEHFYTSIQNLREQVSMIKEEITKVEKDIAQYSAQLEEKPEAFLFQRVKRTAAREEREIVQKKLTVARQEQKRLTQLQKKLSEEITLKELGSPITVEEWKEYREAVKQIDELGGVDAVQKSIDDFLTVNEKMVFLGKRLVCTNVASIFCNSDVHERQYDMVLVDDAQCVQLPSLFALATMAREKCVIAGDPFQVQAEVYATSPAVQEWVQRDIFLYLIQTNELHKMFSWTEQNNEWVVQMKSHIAASSKVSSFIASVVYDDTVTVFMPTKHTGKLFFIDTSDENPECKQYLGKKRILPYNEYHTKVVVNCVKHALLKNHRIASDLGVMFPFVGPTLYTKLQLRMQGMENIEVGTPWQFSGRRKKSIIFDTTMAGVDYTMRAIDDKKIGEHHIIRIFNAVCSSAEEDLYIIANVNHFKSLYQDRLFTRLLLLLYAGADNRAISFEDVQQRFDGMDVRKRASLFALNRDKNIRRLDLSHSAIEDDAEFALQMKMMASRKSETQMPTTADSLEKGIYEAVNRVLGYWKDINLLAQFAGYECVFHNSLPAERMVRSLPFESSDNEKQFRKVIEQWNHLLYELSGENNPSSEFCSSKNMETRTRTDVFKLNAVFNARTDALIQEGKQKLTADVTRIFQEILGKSQPASSEDWTKVYNGLLSRMETYLQWIEKEIRQE